MPLTVEVKGLDKTQKALVAFTVQLRKIGGKEVAKGGQNIINRTKKYPPEIPGSSYKRTGIYGATFLLNKIGALAVKMESDAVQDGRHYSQFVGGGDDGKQQAAIHKGRWPVFKTEADEEATKTAMRIETAAISLIGRLGL